MLIIHCFCKSLVLMLEYIPSHQLSWNLRPFKRKMVLQDLPVRFHVSWWEGSRDGFFLQWPHKSSRESWPLLIHVAQCPLCADRTRRASHVILSGEDRSLNKDFVIGLHLLLALGFAKTICRTRKTKPQTDSPQTQNRSIRGLLRRWCPRA